MITRDYLLRQIHQLAQVLARVLFLKSDQEHQQAIQEIDQALQDLPGLSVLLHAELSQGQLLALCRTESGFSAEKAVALADLLREKGLLVQDEQGRRTYFQYALWLYEAAISEEGATVPWDINQQIAWLKEGIEQEDDEVSSGS